MLDLEAGLKVIGAADLHRVLVALCGETESARDCATCEYEKRSGEDAPCHSWINSRSCPKWEPKEPPAQAIRVCRTCQYDALDGKRQPCRDCVKDYNKGRGSTEWTPKAPPAPKQGYKLEAGCEVIVKGSWRRGMVVCLLGDAQAAIRFSCDQHEAMYSCKFTVTAPATPEVDDYVLWHERNRYGQIHYLDECDSNGVFSLSFAGLLDQPVLRKDFTIIAKARHQEQG